MARASDVEPSLESCLASALGYSPEDSEILLTPEDSDLQSHSDDEDAQTVYSIIDPVDLDNTFAQSLQHVDETPVVDLIAESFGTNTVHNFESSEEQELDAREKAMLDLLILCKRASTPFFL